jgi:Uma2 family endonuclease
MKKILVQLAEVELITSQDLLFSNMNAASIPIPAHDPKHIDQRVFLHDVSWQDYEKLLTIRGESSGTRITYFRGEIELMTPSLDHEFQKKLLARLVEAYADECGIDLCGVGSWTIKQAAKERGIEPDECYVVGAFESPPAIPDIAIEVVWTSGGLEKLAIYRGLKIPEVWFWKNGRLHIYVLQGEEYVENACSQILPGFDSELLTRYMSMQNQTQAVQTFRSILRGEK